MADRFVDTGGGGKWNGYSRGFRTTDASSCVTSVTQRTFWECCTSPVASSCCGVYETTSNGNIAHLTPLTPPNKVQIFLDPNTLSAAGTALDGAINDWNTKVTATGVEFQRVSSSCGSGPDCITVQPVSMLGSCGWTPNSFTDSNGGFVANRFLQIDSGWRTWSSASLQRTFAHELGHSLGMDDYSVTSACDTTGNSAVMQPNFYCNPTATPYRPCRLMTTYQLTILCTAARAELRAVFRGNGSWTTLNVTYGR
jgi:dual-action HEIGH metallo-peptidase